MIMEGMGRLALVTPISSTRSATTLGAYASVPNMEFISSFKSFNFALNVLSNHPTRAILQTLEAARDTNSSA